MLYSAVTQPEPVPRRNGRHPVGDGHGAEHARVAEGDNCRARGVALHIELERERAELIRRATVDP